MFELQKKPQPRLNDLKFETIEEARCVQMLHAVKFVDEPETFKVMEAFAETEGLVRKSKVCRGIYLQILEEWQLKG